jgi:diacylglycerol kinase (ATP)
MSRTAYEWFVVINPNSAGGKGKGHWEKIRKILEKNFISFTSQSGKDVQEAKELLKKALNEGFRNFIVIGGDGTIHQFVNFIMAEHESLIAEIVLAIIPIGTGNDFHRSIHLSNEAEKAIEAIKRRQIQKIDLGLVEYVNEQKQYFINVAGMGFDALVAADVNIEKRNGHDSKLLYLKYLIKHLKNYQYPKICIKMKNYEKTEEFLTILCGNGAYAGGGMKLIPNAKPDDGLFHLTLIKPIGFFKALLSLMKLYNGQIYRLKEISEIITDSFEVSSYNEVFLQLDGEEGSKLPAKFSIIPKAIQVVCDK